MDWTKQFGSAADTYHQFLVPGMFAPCAEIVLDTCGLAPGMRVLDVACGTGVVSRAAARRAGAGAQVVGVDLGEAMLEVARREGVPDGGAAIDYRQGDALALPVEDATFDVAVCQHGMQFFPDRPAALGEMVRAVRPGGVVAVACWSSFDKAPAFGALARALADHIGDEPAAMMQMPFSVGPEELARLLGAAGLEDVSVSEPSFISSFPAHRELARLALQAGPVAPAFLAVPEDVQQAVVDQVADELSPYALPGDRVAAPLSTSIAVGRRPA